MSSIKDKELLAFSNATNLDWQFVELEDKTTGKRKTNIFLNDLLTPESFVRKDSENSDEVEYIYCDTKLSENEKLTPEQIEKGIIEMQEKAGVLMNYLEECGKNSSEGDFLKEWEVVGGFDNYKLAVDYRKSEIKTLENITKKIDEIKNSIKEHTFKKEEWRKILQGLLSNMLDKDFLENKEYIDSIIDGFNEEKQDYIDCVKEVLEEYKLSFENYKNDLTDNVIPARETVEKNHYYREVVRIGLSVTDKVLQTLSFSSVIDGIGKDISNNTVSEKRTRMEAITEKAKVKITNRIKRGYRVKKTPTNKTKEVEINKNVEVEYAEDVIKTEQLDNAVAKTLELITGDIIGGLDLSIDSNNNFINNSSQWLTTAFITLFTRFTGYDYANGLIQEAGEIYIEHLNKSLYYFPSEIKKDTVLNIESRYPLYETGFRATIFKKGNDIVIAYKSDDKTKDKLQLLPNEVSRAKLVYLLVKEKFPKENIVLTGYSAGAELAFLQSTINLNKEDEQGKISGTFFTNNFGSMQGCLNFTIEDFDKTYQSEFAITVYQEGLKVSNKLVLPIIAWIFNPIISPVINPLTSKISEKFAENTFWNLIGGTINKMSSKVLNKIGLGKLILRLGIAGVPHFLVVLAVTAIVNALINIYLEKLKKEFSEKLYEDLETKYKWIEHKENIKGYITNKFVNEENQYEELQGIQVDKALKLCLEFEKKEINFKTKYELTNYEKDKNSKDLFIYNSSERGNLYMETGRDLDKNVVFNDEIYFALSEISPRKYKTVGIFTKRTYYQGVRTTIATFEKLGEFNSNYSRAQIFLSIMQITSQIQRGYEKLIEDKALNFIYVNGSKVEKCNNIPTTEIVPYERENGLAVLNEHVFLPFIQKEGSIKNEIREDYIKNVVKSTIQTLVKNSKYNINKNDIDKELFKLFKEYNKELKNNEIKKQTNKMAEREGQIKAEINSLKEIYFLNTIEKLLDKEKEEYKYDIKKFYTFKRITYNNGLITFEAKDKEMEYGYNNVSPLLRGKYELTLENLKTYIMGKFEGNLEVQNDLFGMIITYVVKAYNSLNNKEKLAEVPEEYKEFVLDFDKTKGLIKGTRGNGEIQIAGKKIGTRENITKLWDKEDNIITWFQKEDILEYYEVLEISAEEKIYIKYFYETKENTLRIRLSKDECYYDREIEIKNFTNGNYSIDLPEYHILTGSEKAKIEEGKKINIDLGSKDLIVSSATGGGAIYIDTEKLGENILKVESESEKIGILKFTDKLAVYLFNYESSILEIILKENMNKAGYGKAILIKEFVNGDFGIKLPTTTPILFGSRFDRERGTEDIQYVFNENTFVPKGGFKDSNGAGAIKIKNKTIGTGKLELLKDYPKKRKTDNVYCEDIAFLKYANSIISNKDDKIELVSNLGKSVLEDNKQENKIGTKNNDYNIKLSRKINFLGDNKFKVVVLKNESKKSIVVSYKNKENKDDKTLTDNIDLLQIVVDKVNKEFKDKGYN